MTEGKLAPAAVTETKVAPAAVTETKVAPEAISTGKIKDGAVKQPQIDAGAVTSAKIDTGAIISSKIEAGAVSSGKLADKVVGTQQIADTVPSASATDSVGSTRNNGSYSVLHFPTTLFDAAGLHAGADYRMTAPVDGIYQTTVVATWANDPACGGTRSLEFNGREADNTTPFLTSPRISSTIVANTSATTTQTLSGMVKLTAGQSIEIWGGASGMACGSTSILGNPASSFTMTWVAPGPAA